MERLRYKKVARNSLEHIKSISQARLRDKEHMLGERLAGEFDVVYLQAARDGLVTKLRGSFGQEVQDFITEARHEDPDVDAHFTERQDLHPLFYDYSTADRLSEMPLGLLGRAILSRKKRREASQETFREQGNGFRREFLNVLDHAIKIGAIQVPISIEEFEARLSNLEFILGDPISPEGFYPLRTAEGWRDADTMRVAYLPLEERSGLQKHIFFHELMHATQGMAICLWEDVADSENKKYSMRRAKDGLMVRGKPDSVTGAEYQLFWLNEGLTEILTAKVLSDGPKTYFEELELIGLIQSSGKNRIPLSLFTNAYFEDFDASARNKGKDHQPHLKTLLHAITDSYGRGFLSQLDKIASGRGIWDMAGGLILATKLMRMNPQLILDSKNAKTEGEVYKFLDDTFYPSS